MPAFSRAASAALKATGSSPRHAATGISCSPDLPGAFARAGRVATRLTPQSEQTLKPVRYSTPHLGQNISIILSHECASARACDLRKKRDCSPRTRNRAPLRALDGEGDGISATEAEGGDATFQTTALQFIEQRDENTRAGCADGMSKRDRAAVHVDLFGIEAQLARDGNGGYCESLVQFVEIDVAIAVPSRFREQLFDGVHRRIITHFGSTPLVACATMRARGCLPSFAATRSLVTTSAAAPSLVPGALPAVTVPSFLNAGLRRARASREVSSRGDSSDLMMIGAPFFCGISMGRIWSLTKQDFVARTALRCESSAY